MTAAAAIPLRPLDSYPIDPMIDWHTRCEMVFAAAGLWKEAHKHALLAERLEVLDRLIAQRNADHDAIETAAKNLASASGA